MAPGIGKFFGSKPSKQSKSSKSRSGSRDDDRSDYARNKEIEKRIYEDKRKAEKEVKIILLGAGESGKSTIVKQMRIIHHGGFDDKERRIWKNHIFHNLVDTFVDIFEIMRSQSTALEDENAHYFNLLFSRRDIALNEGIPMEYYDCFSDLWADEGVQLALLKGNESAIHDNLIYFIESMDRLFDPNYLPSDQDILRTRLRTTGIRETPFEIGQHTYRLVDVGGQRSERKKWIHAFDNVNAILFVAAISGYDQALVEDRDGNQMEEALNLFDEIANSYFFTRAHIILFLNKIDLFQEKMLTGISRISTYYPDYRGSNRDVLAGQKFFFEKFKRRYRRSSEEAPQKELYVHYTNATDTNLLKKTMDIVQNIVLRQNITRELL